MELTRDGRPSGELVKAVQCAWHHHYFGQNTGLDKRIPKFKILANEEVSRTNSDECRRKPGEIFVARGHSLARDRIGACWLAEKGRPAELVLLRIP